jgi:hypothetical protein
MQTMNTQHPHDNKEEPSMMPYIVTWVSAIGIFTLLIWVGVWLVQR